MSFVLYALYALVGALLAIPYCLLAGWNQQNFPLVALVAPIFLFIWFILATFAGVIEPSHDGRRIRINWQVLFRGNRRERLPGSFTSLWLWTLYSLLPIIVHWSAILLNNTGFTSVGTALDTHRYASPLYVLMMIMVLLVFVEMTHSTWEMVKNGWTRLMRH